MAVGKGPGPSKAPKVDLDDLVRRWEADKKSRLFLQLADEYRRQDQVDAAISVLKEGIKVHATFVPAHVALARCLMAKGQPAQAQAELEPIHKKSPDNMMAGKLLAEVLAARGEGGRALSVLKSLRPFAMDDPEVEERIAALESRLQTPSTKSSSSGDTAEFATGEFASSTASMGGATGSFGRPQAAPPAPAAPPPDRQAQGDILDVADDEAVVIDASESDDDVLVVSDESSLSEALASHGDAEASRDPLDDILEPPPELSPMPRPAQGPEDLLGAPLAAAASSPEQDEFMSVTLAELHESQGALERAIEIYERLLLGRPGDAGLRRALDRCRARLAGADVATSVIEAVTAPPPAVARPRWEPIRARPSASTESAAPALAPTAPLASDTSVFAADEGPMGLLGKPAAASARPAAGNRSAAGPAHLRATATELKRWLAAVAAVRQ